MIHNSTVNMLSMKDVFELFDKFFCCLHDSMYVHHSFDAFTAKLSIVMTMKEKTASSLCVQTSDWECEP